MEILLKQPIFFKLTLSVQLLVVWWSEVFLRAIVSTLKSHGNTKGGEEKKKIYGLDKAQKFLAGIKPKSD